VVHAMGPPAPPLDSGGPDEAVGLEPPQARVDEGPRDRPDRPDLTVVPKEIREAPAVARLLRQEREDAELVRAEICRHRQILLVLCTQTTRWNAPYCEGQRGCGSAAARSDLDETRVADSIPRSEVDADALGTCDFAPVEEERQQELAR